MMSPDPRGGADDGDGSVTCERDKRSRLVYRAWLAGRLIIVRYQEQGDVARGVPHGRSEEPGAVFSIVRAAMVGRLL